jgi:DNA invertase Pin-like site-specific DNA recombinase
MPDTTASTAKAAIYARYSGPENESSIRRQVDTCRRYAAEVEATVEYEYVDQPPTGRAGDFRPELRRMLEDAKKGVFDMVIVETGDRVARDLHTLIMIEKEVGRPVHYAAGHHLSVWEEQRAIMIRRQMEGRKAAKTRLAEMGFASSFPFEGKMPKLGRRLHAQLRKMYHAACQAGADRSEVARVLNQLARSIELGRRGNA